LSPIAGEEKSKTLKESIASSSNGEKMHESFEEKEHQKEEETSGKSRRTNQGLSILAVRSEESQSFLIILS